MAIALTKIFQLLFSYQLSVIRHYIVIIINGVTVIIITTIIKHMRQPNPLRILRSGHQVVTNKNHKCGAFRALTMILRHTLRITTSMTHSYQPSCCFFLLLKTSSCCHARDPCPNQYHRGQNGVLLN